MASPSPPPPSPEPGARLTLAACAAACAGLVTCWRTSSSVQWRDDAYAVRDLALVPLGPDGLVSMVLSQILELLPLGSRVLRASLASGLGVALAAGTLAWLGAAATARTKLGALPSRLLSVAAALLAVFSPAWQSAGTVVGGAALGSALALLVVREVLAEQPRPLALGALLAATLLEAAPAGLVVALAMMALAGVQRRLPTRRSTLEFVVGAGLAAGLLLAPCWLRRGFAPIAALAAEHSAAVASVWSSWLPEVGPLGLVLAGWGALVLVRRGDARAEGSLWAVIVGLDALLIASQGELATVLQREPLAPLRLLSVAALSLLGLTGLTAAIAWVRRSPQPLVRAAVPLLVVLQVSRVLVTAEDSGHALGLERASAAEVWTDEALEGLPPSAVLLVRSEAVAYRLWAAKVIRGQREDVTVVPVPLLSRRSFVEALLQREPALAALIRELLVTGRPTELALSTLADARPLYLELDPEWDPRLNAHLLPEGLWLRFMPHALGRSDRSAGIEGARRAVVRVARAARTDSTSDRATLDVLLGRSLEHLALLRKLGDRAAARAWAAELRDLDPSRMVAQQGVGTDQTSSPRDSR